MENKKINDEISGVRGKYPVLGAMFSGVSIYSLLWKEKKEGAEELIDKYSENYKSVCDDFVKYWDQVFGFSDKVKMILSALADSEEKIIEKLPELDPIFIKQTLENLQQLKIIAKSKYYWRMARPCPSCGCQSGRSATIDTRDTISGGGRGAAYSTLYVCKTCRQYCSGWGI